jgi:hypothetical protein
LDNFENRVSTRASSTLFAESGSGPRITYNKYGIIPSSRACMESVGVAPNIPCGLLPILSTQHGQQILLREFQYKLTSENTKQYHIGYAGFS